MKKRVFIGFIAAMMLFAFTACDNSAGNGQILNVSVSRDVETVYLPGESVNLDDYTITLETTAGTKAGDASALGLSEDDLIVEEGDTSIKASYLGTWGVVLPVTVGEVTKIEVNGDNAAVKTYYTTANTDYQKIDLTGVAIEATYEADGVEGKREISADNKYVEATLDDWVNADKAAIVTVKYLNDSFKDTYKVSVETNLIQSVALKTTEDYVVYKAPAGATTNQTVAYAAPDSSDPTKLAKGAKGVYMEATYQNGEVKILAATNNVTFRDTTSKYTITDISTLTLPTSGNLKVYAKYTGADGMVDLNPLCETDVTVATDSVKDVDLGTTPTQLKIGTYLADQADLVNEMFGEKLVATKEWVSETADATEINYKATEGGDRYVFDNLDFSDYENNDTATVNVTVYVGTQTFNKSFEVTMVTTLS